MERELRASIKKVDLGELAGVIRGGGVVVLPTDTIYGFHCAVSKRAAVERVRKLKGRGKIKGFVLLASDFEMVDGIVSGWPYESREMLSSIWPAPLTAVLPAADSLPRLVVSRGKVAVRIPRSEWLTRLIAMVAETLVSTSVNRSGSKPLTRMKEIIHRFPGLDFYVTSAGRSSTAPSTLVDFTCKRPRVIRHGRYRFNDA